MLRSPYPGGRIHRGDLHSFQALDIERRSTLICEPESDALTLAEGGAVYDPPAAGSPLVQCVGQQGGAAEHQPTVAGPETSESPVDAGQGPQHEARLGGPSRRVDAQSNIGQGRCMDHGHRAGSHDRCWQSGRTRELRNNMAKPLSSGESCLLIDERGKKYLVRLDPGHQFQSHTGQIAHAEIIGRDEGDSIETSSGHRMLVLRPGLADFVLKMKRGPQVVYPKDLGAIVIHADIAPGSLVLEAGTGSGGLTIALLRAVGPRGRVISVDRRADHAARGRKSIVRFFGDVPANLELEVGEVEDFVGEVEPDRLVLDLPEPWRSVEPAVSGLEDGGVFCAYLPTVPQIQRTVEALDGSGAFAETVAFETLMRTWKIKGRSVRPNHNMVGHTGFVVVSRKVKPEISRRAMN